MVHFCDIYGFFCSLCSSTDRQLILENNDERMLMGDWDLTENKFALWWCYYQRLVLFDDLLTLGYVM